MTLGEAKVRAAKAEKSLNEVEVKVLMVKAKAIDIEARFARTEVGALVVEEALSEAWNQTWP